MTASPTTLATLIRGSVDPTAHPHEPRILTDAGCVQLRLGGWLLLTDDSRHRLGSWRSSAEDVAVAYWCRVEAVAA
jgi:hypothetical protein